MHLDKYFPKFVLWNTSFMSCTWKKEVYGPRHLTSGDLQYATVIPP